MLPLCICTNRRRACAPSLPSLASKWGGEREKEDRGSTRNNYMCSAEAYNLLIFQFSATGLLCSFLPLSISWGLKPELLFQWANHLTCSHVTSACLSLLLIFPCQSSCWSMYPWDIFLVLHLLKCLRTMLHLLLFYNLQWKLWIIPLQVHAWHTTQKNCWKSACCKWHCEPGYSHPRGRKGTILCSHSLGQGQTFWLDLCISRHSEPQVLLV